MSEVKYWHDFTIQWIFIALMHILFSDHLKQSSFCPTGDAKAMLNVPVHVLGNNIEQTANTDKINACNNVLIKISKPNLSN
jgi:hypothetical protein